MTDPRPVRPYEVVPQVGAARGPERAAIDALDEVRGESDRGAEPELIRLVARGRRVGFLREQGQSYPTWIQVFEVPGDRPVLVVHDAIRPRWTGYRAPDVESALAAARGILGSGSAFNW